MSERRKPELELLIRRPSSSSDLGSSNEKSASYITKRYVANEVVLSVRPRRISSKQCEIREQVRTGGEVFYVVRNIATDQYLFLNDREYFVWQKMDGDHTLRAIATAYFFKYGSFDFRMIQSFLTKAKEQDLILMPRTELIRTVQEAEVSRSVVGRLWTKLRGIDLRIKDVDAKLTQFYSRFRFLFTRPMLMVHAAIFVAGAFAYWKLIQQMGMPDFETIALFLPLIIPTYLLTFIVHEMAHALTCKHFGREVKAFGFTLMNGFLPSFYADVTDIWMSTRAARIAVSFAGPLSGFMLAAISAIAGVCVSPSWWSHYFLCFSTLMIATGLITLYPFLFLEFDGYHILTDILKQTALRERAPRFFRRDLWRKLRTGKRLTPEDLSLLWYGFFSTLSVAVLVAGFATLLLRTILS